MDYRNFIRNREKYNQTDTYPMKSKLSLFFFLAITLSSFGGTKLGNHRELPEYVSNSAKADGIM